MKSIIILFSIFALSFLSSCILDKGTTLINFGNKPDPYLVKKAGGSVGTVDATISNVAIVNDQLVINGSGLDNVDTISLNGNSFAIESKSSSSIVANGAAAFSYVVGQIFDLVLSNAYGAATYQVTFTLSDNTVTTSKIVDGQVMTADLADGAVTAAKLSTVGATAGSVIQFDGTNWGLVNLNGLTYQGTWNASTNSPSLSDASGNCNGYNPGDYFAVSVTGSTFIDGENSWAAGDWIICSNGTWDKVINTTNITSVFGRTGAVTATLSDMTDVDSSLTSVDGQLLIYRNANSRYETANFLTFDWLNSGNATFTGSVTITGSSLTVGGTNVCLADGTNCAIQVPTTVNNPSGATVINNSSGLSPIELQMSGATKAQLDTTGTFVVTDFRVTGGTPGAGKVLMSDVSGTGTWQIPQISNVQNLQTTLDAKVAKVDVPSCTDLTKHLVWDGSTWSCMTFTDTNTNAATICNAGEYLDGDGTCKSVAAGGADNSQAGNVQLIADNDSNTTGEIQFMIGATTPMVIDNSGNVGIGTPTPSVPLHVIGNQYLSGVFEWNNNKGRLTSGASGVPMLTTVGANDLAIGTNGATELIRLDESTQRVGIGTTAPSSKLDVQGGSITVGNSSTAAANQVDIYHSDLAQTWISLKRGASTKANIRSEGGFMIDLTPQGAGGTGFLRLSGSTVSDVFTIRNSSDQSVVRFLGDKNVLFDGNVGIGVAAPVEKLEVDGKIQVTATNDVCISGGNCLSAMSATTGDITSVNTATGSGLTGGAATGDANLSVDVDGSTLEIDGVTNKVRVKDAGVTDAKVVGVGVQKITSGAGNYFTYAPAGTACGLNQVLKLDGSGRWVCANDIDTTDNLGNHTATQNLNLGTNQLIGNGGSTGLAVNADGSTSAVGYRFIDGGRAIKTYEFAASPSVGNLKPLARFHNTEGTVSIMVQISSATSGNSGTGLYLFQGGFAQLGGTSWRRMIPHTNGRGHGESTTGYDLYVRQSQDAGSGSYGYEFGVASNSTVKNLRVRFIKLNVEVGYPTIQFVDISGQAEEVASSAGDVYSVREQFIESKLGVGTSSPSSALQVVGTVTATAFSGDGSALTNISSASADNPVDMVISADTDSNSTGQIKFNTGGTTKATLTNDGDFGIGSVPTASKFEVTQVSGGSPTATFNMVDNTANNFVVKQGTNEYINVDTTNTTEKVTIGNTTTDPDIELQGEVNLRRPANQLNIFESDGTDPLDAFIMNFDGGTLDFVFKDNSAGPSYSSYLKFDNGKVGILNPTPDTYVHIKPPGDAGYLKIEGISDGSNFSAVELESDEAIDKKWQLRHAAGADLNDFMLSYHDGATWYSPLRVKDNMETHIGNSITNAVRIEPGMIRMQDNTDAGRSLEYRGTKLAIGQNNGRTSSANNTALINAYSSSDGQDILKLMTNTAAGYVKMTQAGVNNFNMDFAQNNVSQLYLKNDGNVGIGTNTPYAKLNVVGLGQFENESNDNSAPWGVSIVRKRADAVAPLADFGISYGFLLEGFSDSSFSSAGEIGVRWDKNQTNNTTDRDSYMSFNTAQDNALSEKMRITSNGNVGIGNTDPLSKLAIGDSIGSGYGITANSSTQYGAVIQTSEAVPTNAAAMWVRTTPDGGTTANTLFRVENNGKVGIGTSAPSSQLHVEDDAPVSLTLRHTGASKNDPATIIIDETVDNAGQMWIVPTDDFDAGSAQDKFHIGDYGTSTSYFTVQGNGNVGIGKSSPASKLDVNGTIRATEICDENGANCNDLSTGSGLWDNATGGINYSGGKVGIGVASPMANLHVGAGPIFIGANPSSWSTNGIVVNSSSTRSDISFIHSSTGSNQTGDGLNIAQVFNRAEFNLKENDDMVFLTNNTEAVRIKNDGKVGIGTTTPSKTFEVNGSIKAAGEVRETLTRSLSTVLNDTVAIGKLTNNSRGTWIKIRFDVHSSSTIDAHLYEVYLTAYTQAATNDGWLRLPPQAGSSAWQGDSKYEVEIKRANQLVSNGDYYLRIRNATGGVGGGTGYVTIEYDSSVVFTPLTSTSTTAIAWDSSTAPAGGAFEGTYGALGYEFPVSNGHGWAASGDKGMTITNSGKVGVGTRTPASELTVVGTIESTSGGIKFPDGSTQTTAAASPAIFQAYPSANQSTPGIGTWTKIPINTVEFDSDGFYDTTNQWFKPTQAGYYKIGCSVHINMTGTGAFTLYTSIFKNGAQGKTSYQLINYAAGFSQTIHVNTIIYFNGTTDYIDCRFQTNSGTATAQAGSNATFLHGEFLRP